MKKFNYNLSEVLWAILIICISIKVGLMRQMLTFCPNERVLFHIYLSACAWWYKSMAYLIELYQMLSIFLRCVQVVIVRPLSVVSSLVRFAEEPQMFAIEFSDGCPIHVRIAWLPFEISCVFSGKFLMCISWL